MKALLLQIIDYWNKRKLKGLGTRVCVKSSTRLLRSFNVRFLSQTDSRRFLDIGETCILNNSIIFESNAGHVVIGDRCYIGAGTSIISRNSIKIGNDVTMAWGITVYDHDSHSVDWKRRAEVVAHFYKNYGRKNCFDKIDWSGVTSKPIIIADRVWIGFNVVVLKGVTIGEGAIVGAGSVVTRNVDPYTIVAGNPATTIRKLRE